MTDTRSKQTTYTYDLDGRKTFAYDTSGGATASTSDEIGAWTYDTLKKDYPTSCGARKVIAAAGSGGTDSAGTMPV